MQHYCHKYELAALYREQKCLRTLFTGINDPVYLLLYRSRRQAFLRIIRQKCNKDGIRHVIQQIMELEKHIIMKGVEQIV